MIGLKYARNQDEAMIFTVLLFTMDPPCCSAGRLSGDQLFGLFIDSMRARILHLVPMVNKQCPTNYNNLKKILKSPFLGLPLLVCQKKIAMWTQALSGLAKYHSILLQASVDRYGDTLLFKLHLCKCQEEKII